MYTFRFPSASAYHEIYFQVIYPSILFKTILLSQDKRQLVITIISSKNQS
jgi:hypothetical protein